MRTKHEGTAAELAAMCDGNINDGRPVVYYAVPGATWFVFIGENPDTYVAVREGHGERLFHRDSADRAWWTFSNHSRLGNWDEAHRWVGGIVLAALASEWHEALETAGLTAEQLELAGAQR